MYCCGRIQWGKSLTCDLGNCDASLGSSRQIHVVRANASSEGQAELLGPLHALGGQECRVEGCGNQLQQNTSFSISSSPAICIEFCSPERSALCIMIEFLGAPCAAEVKQDSNIQAAFWP